MSPWFFELNIIEKIIIIYLLLINIISFFNIGLDKLKAQLHHSRTREMTLWLLALVGGSLGTILSMYFFRHKTQKNSFQAVLIIILLIQILLVYLLWW